MIQILPTKCDKCGATISSFYSRGTDAWFSKYLQPNEETICLSCIKERTGFREEFQSLVGISVEELENLRAHK